MFANGTLFTADQTWPLLALMCGWVALSIWLEQKYKWASKLSGAILALIGALLMVNLNIIPVSAPVFDDFVWGIAVPLAIPMLLLKCDLKKMWKDTGRFLVIFLIGSVGTIVGALLAFVLLRGTGLENLAASAATMTGSYIGGGVNFSALAATYMAGTTTIGSLTVADNLLMALYFFVLLFIPTQRFFLKKYLHPHMDEVQAGLDKSEVEQEKTRAAAFWGRKEISIKDIAINVALAAIIVMISQLLAGWIGGMFPADGGFVVNLFSSLLGSQYIWITTLSILVATLGSRQADQISGSQEIGTYLIYLFFFVIGVPASIGALISQAPLLLVLTGVMVLVNMLFSFGFGRLFKFSLEEIILASNANIGGPTTAAAMAISQGWTKLIGPSMLIGTFGYALGTYLGVIVYNILTAL